MEEQQPGQGLAGVPGLGLRPIVEQDRPFLCYLYGTLREPELAMVTDWSPERKREFVEQQFTAQDAYYREHYPGASLQLIELHGEPIGRLYVDRWTAEIRVMDIALVPEARGQGLGERLLRFMQDEAAAAGKALTIHVERFNPALRLYSRLGFRLKEDKGVYYFLEWLPGSPAGD
ncbi:MAG TPA: GNAT family N-acetyltransferase [Thermoanaerobaculia bacterium]|nr:GNAT family N-acetyltransferase [Thermoanaerobaculia bacterium]